MAIIDDFNVAYFNLLFEVYHYRSDPNPIPSVGRKRDFSGLRPRNTRAYRKLHIIDTKMGLLMSEMIEAMKEMTEWKADFEKKDGKHMWDERRE